MKKAPITLLKRLKNTTIFCLQQQALHIIIQFRAKF